MRHAGSLGAWFLCLTGSKGSWAEMHTAARGSASAFASTSSLFDSECLFFVLEEDTLSVQNVF